MNEQLLARSISERMFTRQVHAVDDLLDDSDSSVRIIERQLATLYTRWTALQESHDSFVIQFVSDSIELSANDSFIDKYSSEFMRLEVACDSFISSRSVNKSSSVQATSSKKN